MTPYLLATCETTTPTIPGVCWSTDLGLPNKERPQAGLAGLPSMAFKREGDDLSQLNVLRKRRVADLLASYIPEDEAVLMRNG
ncbi:hypothetical protein chiPu_0024383, partial [Chiloscyllium punctatum]|nr:hypothetical protein [Chiloscyllium punctatum]